MALRQGLPCGRCRARTELAPSPASDWAACTPHPAGWGTQTAGAHSGRTGSSADHPSAFLPYSNLTSAAFNAIQAFSLKPQAAISCTAAAYRSTASSNQCQVRWKQARTSQTGSAPFRAASSCNCSRLCSFRASSVGTSSSSIISAAEFTCTSIKIMSWHPLKQPNSTSSAEAAGPIRCISIEAGALLSIWVRGHEQGWIEILSAQKHLLCYTVLHLVDCVRSSKPQLYAQLWQAQYTTRRPSKSYLAGVSTGRLTSSILSPVMSTCSSSSSP